VDFAARTRLPALYPYPEFVQLGGLMSTGPSYPSMFHRASLYVDQVLNGTKAGDLPIEPPTTFDVLVNRTTVQELGITFPPDAIAQVTEWIG
jgi:putative tryptophan/tyrosine transport system substrate-binding protein